MPSTLNLSRSVLIVLFAAEAATAQPAPATLDGITAEDCAPLADDPSSILVERLDGQGDSAIVSLLIDAVTRQCAAIGAIDAPGRPDEEGTRSTNPFPEESEPERLAAEAQYLLETAMQIDPDAANDLLRRLLGSRPKEDG